MSKLRLNITMSIDGFIAGPDQSLENPLGVGGEQLHTWLTELAIFQDMHGGDGGTVNESTAVVEEWFEGIGATIMGRNMFGGGPGPWGADPWRGWWGDDPPYHTPVFVLTHHARDPLPMQGGTTFHFVTGIEAAVEQARAAADGSDVALAGGANVIQQCLALHLVDEMELSIVPVVLGGGSRLFDNVGGAGLRLEQVRAIEAPGVTHITYRVR
jgi:dihydrofolate reductase